MLFKCSCFHNFKKGSQRSSQCNKLPIHFQNLNQINNLNSIYIMNWSHESEKHVLQSNNMGSSRSSPGPPATCYSHLTAETFHRNTCKKNRRREAPPVTFLYIRSTERANAEQCVLAALQHPPEPCSFVLSFGNGSEKWFWLNFRKLLCGSKKRERNP